jgi:hypothetical protein
MPDFAAQGYKCRATMFRGEKNTQWEGGFRVPCLIKWPGTIVNDIGSHEDMFPTLLAAGLGKIGRLALGLLGALLGGIVVHVGKSDFGWGR